MPASPEQRARRAARRQRTLDLARRRRDEHLRRTHFDDTTGLTRVDCVCELSNTYFAKRTAFGCGCSKRRKGRPRVSSGMCDIGVRERVYQWRGESRELREAVRSGRGWGEAPVRVRGSAKHKPPRVFVLEKQDVGRKGERYGWFPYRKYRTKADRDNALAALRKGSSHWWGGGLRAEFRAAA